MTDRTSGSNKQDKALRERFQQLRNAEQATAPAFPGSSAGGEPGNVVPLAPAPHSASPSRSLPAIAAAVAIVAVGIGFVTQSPQDDPALLYSEIMSGQSMQTDVLMHVSSSVLPAAHELPQLYDTNFSYDTDTLIN